TVIRRDLHPLKELPRVMSECGLLVGGVLMILGVALGFTHYLVDAQIPDQMVEWSTHAIRSKWLFLLGLNVVLLFVGGLIEIYAAIVVVVPLLVPVGVAFGIDPVHLGIIFLANMELGFIAPPVGLNLLLSSYRFNKPILEVMRAVLPCCSCCSSVFCSSRISRRSRLSCRDCSSSGQARISLTARPGL